MAKSWDDINPQTGGDRDKFRLEDYFRLVDKKKLDCKGGKPKYFPFRFHGGVVSFEQAWIPLYKDGRPVIAQKGGNAGKGVEIPKLILSYNPDTEEYDPNIQDPYFDLVQRMNEILGDAKDEHGNSKRVRIQRTYLSNVINRTFTRVPRNPVYPTDEEAQSGFMSGVDSETYTPFDVYPMPAGLAERVKNLKQLNVHTFKGQQQSFSVAHPQAGRDVNIKYDSGQSGQGMYDVQLGSQRAPLTKEELEAVVWDIDAVTRYIQSIDIDAAAKDADQLARGFFSGGGSSRRAQRTLTDDDLPEDLANSGSGRGRGRGRQAVAEQSDFGGGGDDFGADEFGAAGNDFAADDFGSGGGGDDFGSEGGGDFGADDFGSGADFGDNGDFGTGGDDFGSDGSDDFGSDDFGASDDFAAPQPAQRSAPAQNRGQQQRPSQQGRAPAAQQQRGGRQQAVVDAGDLDGLDDTGDEFSNSEADFGSDDFGAADDFAAPPVRRGPAPQQQNRGQQRPSQQQPAQNRNAQPQNKAPQQQRPPQGNSAPAQNRGPQQNRNAAAPTQNRAPQQQRTSQQQPAQNRGPQQQRPPQGGSRPPQGGRR